MRVLIFEWLTGGGLWFDGLDLDTNCPFQVQGRAMFEALTSDFLESGHQILCTVDRRIKLKSVAGLFESKRFPISHKAELIPAITQLANEADAILVIAPECDGCLNRVVQWLAPQQQKLISPNATFVGLASDKHATMRWLGQRGIAVPEGIRVACPGDAKDRVLLPAIGKPNTGAGSDNVHLIEDWEESRNPDSKWDWRIESFVAGQSVSVSVISGGRQHVLLTPTGQVFDRPLGHYAAAQYPLSAAIAKRATELALATTNALPATKGYFGIDMIIGDDDACVLEVNPRLTMSYLWLREIAPFNLARKMLELAELGQPASTPKLR